MAEQKEEWEGWDQAVNDMAKSNTLLNDYAKRFLQLKSEADRTRLQIGKSYPNCYDEILKAWREIDLSETYGRPPETKTEAWLMSRRHQIMNMVDALVMSNPNLHSRQFSLILPELYFEDDQTGENMPPETFMGMRIVIADVPSLQIGIDMDMGRF